MTGRELVVYILANHLEDAPVFKDGELLGFLTLGEAAEAMGVGTATVLAMALERGVDYIVHKDTVLVPADIIFVLEKEESKN